MSCASRPTIPGPFTFHGTNSYIVGRDTLAVIDPGPDDDAHLAALLDGHRRAAGQPYLRQPHASRPFAAGRQAEGSSTGAIVCAEGPHRPARPLRIGEINPLDASADMDFRARICSLPTTA